MPVQHTEYSLAPAQVGWQMHSIGRSAAAIYEQALAESQAGLDNADESADSEKQNNFLRLAEHKELQVYLGLPAEHVFMLAQVHGDRAHFIETDQQNKSGPLYDRGDALFTMHPGHALVVRTADCLPLLFAFRLNEELGPGADSTPRRPVLVGAVHAGWRGMQVEIIKKTIKLAWQSYSRVIPIDVDVVLDYAIGPCIGGDVYQVGPEVARVFKSYRPQPGVPGKFLLDLMAEAKDQVQSAISQLQSAGDSRIQTQYYSELEACTLRHTDFYSHRAGDKFRNLNVIQII